MIAQIYAYKQGGRGQWTVNYTGILIVDSDLILIWNVDWLLGIYTSINTSILQMG